MCSLGDLKFVMENIWFPQETYGVDGIECKRNVDKRFETLCNCHRIGEYEDVIFLLDWLGKNSDKSDDYKLPQKMAKMIQHKIVKSKCKGMSFYTIVPRTKVRDEPGNIKKFEDYCELMFKKRGDKYFKQVWYVIECGKHENDSNLHIHVLCDFKELGSKFFLRDLKKYWLNYFPEQIYDITYKLNGNDGIHRVDCNTNIIIKDKIDYMDNETKGSHENYRDLGLRFHHVFEV